MAANRYLNPKQFREFNADPSHEHTDVPHPEWTGIRNNPSNRYFVGHMKGEQPVHKNWLHPDNAHWTADMVPPSINTQSRN